MSSIRPLITITILVVVGVFLFTKINEGPAHVTPGMHDSSQGETMAGIPALASTADHSAGNISSPGPTWGSETTAAIEPAPQWAGENVESAPEAIPSAAEPMSAPVAETTTAIARTTIPAIPELPPLAPPNEFGATMNAPSATAPIALPANIPIASYPGAAGATNAAPAEPAVVAVEPSPIATAVEPVAPVADRYATMPITPTTEPDSSQATTYTATPTEPSAGLAPPTQPSFATSWPMIQGALERQELVQAHEMLSAWYGSPNLSPVEAQQIESLLGQLAGTVVYSTEHRLEPPYMVQAGDTLQTIAQRYEVPWQLLAKINGIPAADMVQPGQQLKVVHGPFSAVVELEKSQMTLMLDGRYAGRFPIAIEPAATASEGEWVLEQKLVNPATEASGVVSASYAAPTSVDRVLVLRSESPTTNGATISITGGPASPSGPTAIAPPAIRLAPADVEEVADILSVGSRVTICR